jgi:hypothetical protein
VHCGPLQRAPASMPATGLRAATQLLMTCQCIAGVCCRLHWQDRSQGGAAAEGSRLQSQGRCTGEATTK